MRKFLALLLCFQATVFAFPFVEVVNDARLWCEVEEPERAIEELGTYLASVNGGIGFADATAQNSYVPNSQWHPWIQQMIPTKHQPPWDEEHPGFYRQIQSQAGRDQIIAKLKETNATCYRFSIEWSYIQPTSRDEWIEEAIHPYRLFAKDLKASGIKPAATLHHFSEPQWFHALGGFESEDNIEPFVAFARFAVDQLKDEVDLFYAINEPAIDAFLRYILGEFSPGYHARWSRAGQYLKTCMKAHVKVYEAIHSQVEVGFIHQRLKSRGTNVAIDQLLYYLNELINESTLRFLKTGRFSFYVPMCCDFDEQITRGPPPFDVLGLQYYVRPYIGMLGVAAKHEEPLTNMPPGEPFPEDPEGIFEALLEIASVSGGCPIDVTEVGCAAVDSEQRSRHQLRTFYAMNEARKAGVPLRNVFWWCCFPSSEWVHGMKMGEQNFSAFSVNEDGSFGELKEGWHHFSRLGRAAASPAE